MKIVAKGYFERSLFIVGEGVLKAFKGSERITYYQGSVIGSDVFMTGGCWEYDLYACRDGWILKYDYDDYLDLVE